MLLASNDSMNTRETSNVSWLFLRRTQSCSLWLQWEQYRALTEGGSYYRNKIHKNIKLHPIYGLRKNCWAFLHHEHRGLQVLSFKYFHKK